MFPSLRPLFLLAFTRVPAWRCNTSQPRRRSGGRDAGRSGDEKRERERSNCLYFSRRSDVKTEFFQSEKEKKIFPQKLGERKKKKLKKEKKNVLLFSLFVLPVLYWLCSFTFLLACRTVSRGLFSAFADERGDLVLREKKKR